MKFEELRQIEELRNEIFKKFEKELNDFRSTYNLNEFELNYADTDHLIVTTENILDYSEKIHNTLCDYFKVKLTHVNRLNQQSARGEYLTIEYIYQPVDVPEQAINWEDIRL